MGDLDETCQIRVLRAGSRSAVLCALIAGSLMQDVGRHTLGAAPLALLAAGVVAWRVRSLAAPTAAALVVMLAAGLLPA